MIQQNNQKLSSRSKYLARKIEPFTEIIIWKILVKSPKKFFFQRLPNKFYDINQVQYFQKTLDQFPFAMGNIQTRSELPDKKGFHILDYGYCRVWKRKSDALQTMEEYHLAIGSEERLKLFENAWPLRTNHNIFVNVYYFSHHKATNFCGELARGSLFTQRIPYRLSQFANVKYPQIIAIMKSCIEGYSILQQHYGLFIIRSTMIGFTENFQPKIWLHTDFSQPEPQNPNCKNLNQMFASLISAVQSTCEYLYYNCPRFSQFIIQTNYVYFSRDFKWLMKGLEAYVQKLGILLPQNLTGMKGYIKQPEGWEKFKAKKSYPKLIPTDTEIQSAKTIAEPLKITDPAKIPQPTKIPVPESYFLKKQVTEPVISSNQMTPTLKKTYSSRGFQNQTNSRVLFQSFAVDPQKMNQNTIIFPSKIQSQYTTRHQMAKKEELKFWRSSQKINLNQSQFNPSYIKSVNDPPSITRFHSPRHRMNFNKQVSNEYYGESLHEIKQLSSRRASNTRNSENFNLGRKSFDVSTDTRNRDKSLKEELSLIEDLQVKDRNSTPYNGLKFN